MVGAERFKSTPPKSRKAASPKRRGKQAFTAPRPIPQTLNTQHLHPKQREQTPPNPPQNSNNNPAASARDYQLAVYRSGSGAADGVKRSHHEF